MEPGTRVLERYRLDAALPAAEGQVRFAATDEATGEAVEVVGPTVQVALRPGAAEAFARAAVEASRAGGPLLPRTAAGAAGTRPLAARPPTAGPLPPDLRLDDAEARRWLAWLAPAVLASGGALGGRLGPEDLVLDPEGVVRLSPAGLAPPPHRLRPDPHLPADGAAGAPGESALHGLGVFLFQAATGSLPDGRPARALRPDLSPELEAALAGLLSPVPADRRAVAESAGAAAPTPPAPVALPSPASSTAAAPGGATAPASRIKTTRDAPARAAGRVDLPRHPWVVTVDPAALTGAARRRAAALADQPLDVVEGLAAAGLPLVIAGRPVRTEAEAEAARLAGLGLEPVVHSGAPPTGPAGAALGAGLLALGALLAAALAVPFGALLGPLVLPVVAAGLLLGLPLGWLALRQGGEARQRMALDRARDTLLETAGVASPDPVAAARRAIRAAHRAVLEADLPAPVRLDLEGSLDALRAELSALAATPEAPDAAGRAGAIAELAAEIGTAAVPASAPGPRVGEDLDAEIRRRAAAARAAAAELHRS